MRLSTKTTSLVVTVLRPQFSTTAHVSERIWALVSYSPSPLIGSAGVAYRLQALPQDTTKLIVDSRRDTLDTAAARQATYISSRHALDVVAQDLTAVALTIPSFKSFWFVLTDGALQPCHGLSPGLSHQGHLCLCRPCQPCRW